MVDDVTEIDIASRFGGLGEEVGQGRHKRVHALDNEGKKVLVSDKESGKPPEYHKAQYYMQ